MPARGNTRNNRCRSTVFAVSATATLRVSFFPPRPLLFVGGRSRSEHLIRSRLGLEPVAPWHQGRRFSRKARWLCRCVTQRGSSRVPGNTWQYKQGICCRQCSTTKATTSSEEISLQIPTKKIHRPSLLYVRTKMMPSRRVTLRSDWL